MVLCQAVEGIAAIDAHHQDRCQDQGVLHSLVRLTSRISPEDSEVHAACCSALSSLAAVNASNADVIKSSGVTDLVRGSAPRSSTSSRSRKAGATLLTVLVSMRPERPARCNN